MRPARPPGSGPASTTVTSRPAPRSRRAADSPASPAPTTTTRSVRPGTVRSLRESGDLGMGGLRSDGAGLTRAGAVGPGGRGRGWAGSGVAGGGGDGEGVQGGAGVLGDRCVGDGLPGTVG